jgi:acyl-CoA reductase-like NAD-dependent aldehyde dehydrogenase
MLHYSFKRGGICAQNLFRKSFNAMSTRRSFADKTKVCVVDNPYTMETYTEVPYVNPTQIPIFIENANSAISFLNSIPLSEKINICRHAMKWFVTNEDKVARDITGQMGKPLSQAKKEITTMLDRCEHMFKLAEDVLKEDIIAVDSQNYVKITKEPIGISYIISPWNYPLLTVSSGLIPSILCGNPVLLKHSIRTPLVGHHFEEAFKSVGAINVVQHLFLSNETAHEVYNFDGVNYVGFTGSVETGKAVQRGIAKSGRFIGSSYELGGKDAAYVREDADLDFTVDNIVDGCMYNSGQSCCAIERVYVHSKLYDQFIDKAANLIKKTYVLGDPLDPKTNLGPLALPDAPLFIKEQVDEAVNTGAELLLGGSIINDSNGKGRFFEPTLIKDCRNDMQVMIKETFGPIIPVARVENDSEAIDLMNNTEFGLTNAIYTKDYKIAADLGSKVNLIFINTHSLVK